LVLIISPRKKQRLLYSKRIANGSWFWDWSRPVNVGRTKAEFDALISKIASLEPEELFDSDTCIWSLSHDDKFLVNSVRKHIDELSRISLSPMGSLVSDMARLKGKEGPRLRHLYCFLLDLMAV
ncbi:hypothetical protein Tco_0196890, partial [Tanacetum coccineum]